ncbi:nucleotidyltransferase domain-containing protein [Pseudalkalibacillus hwajinpoensis]|uniref:Nucleotidyltransferase domain-containing protein n=1 Tax=Guptibacillus hwajinpoensis TaxID=208199 RepID=A0A4U1M9L8_9BACL|nr:nucleotidyltransferase domain-containing protein [Pseudalkalibacillus hwajinpoensis]TKD67477.1 nucleotidyltransferase domain-containing protein [Pseudalkalibacillus hwajinpoensis]
MLNPLMTPLMIEQYAKRLVDRLKTSTLRGIVLTGSFARGEGGPFSDLDVWCFYNDKKIKPSSIPELTGVTLDLREVNLKDFMNDADGTREYVAPCFEQLNVFGETPFVLPSRQKIKEGVMKLLVSTEQRLKRTLPPVNQYEILNDVMYLLRIERYLLTSQYPLTLSELYSIQFEENNRLLVEYYSSYLYRDRTVSEEEIRSVMDVFLNKRL